MRARTLTTIIAGLLAALSASAVTVTTTPVGFVKQTVNEPGKLTFLNLGLTRPILRQSLLTGIAGTTVFDASALWADNEYNGQHFLEIVSGPNAGLIVDIVSSSAAGQSLTLSVDLTGVIDGDESYRIRQHQTIASLFGATNTAGLIGGTSTTADLINLYNSALNSYDVYYYSTSAFPVGIGWRKAGGGNTDAANTIVPPTDVALIQRRSGSSFELVQIGEVKLGDTQAPGGEGLNFFSVPFPVTTTLANSGLYTGDPATGVAGGTSTTADLITIYDGTTGVYSDYYYSTVAFPTGIGWRRAGGGATDQSNVTVGDQGFLVQRKNPTSFFWKYVPPPIN